MKTGFLPPPDNICLEGMARLISEWLQERCAPTTEAPLPIDWNATINLNVFYQNAAGERVLGVRMNDTFGQQITIELEKKPKGRKKPGRRLLTDEKLSKLEKDRKWDKAMRSGPEEPEAEGRPRPDAFRYLERGRTDDDAA